MTFDVGQRVEGDRRRMAGTVGVVAFVLVMLAGVGVLLLARGGAETGGGAETRGGAETSGAVPADAAVAAGGPPARGAFPDPGPSRAAVAESAPTEAGDVAPVDPETATVPEGVPADPSGGSFVPPARRVALPLGAEQVEEYPVRFPGTPEGAAAAAVALTRYSATLDYLTATQVMGLYVAGDHAAAAEGAATAAVEAARTRLGVPLSGDPPADASMVALPIGVQWESLPAAEGAATQVRVSVLSVAEYRAAGDLQREVVSVDHYAAWDAGAGDWRFVPPPDGGLAGPPQAELGTAAFNDNGWAAIVEDHP